MLPLSNFLLGVLVASDLPSPRGLTCIGDHAPPAVGTPPSMASAIFLQEAIFFAEEAIFPIGEAGRKQSYGQYRPVIKKGAIMTILDLLYEEYCRARLAEMSTQLLLRSPQSNKLPNADTFDRDSLNDDTTARGYDSCAH